MAEFIYNRTQNHVDRLKLLRSKGYENLTASEIAEYNGYAALGAYNVSDLNRVEFAVAELAARFKLGLTTKTDWTRGWSFTEQHSNRYIANVVAIRNAALAVDPALVFPTLPADMHKLTYEGANNIEETLEIASRVAPILNAFVLDESTLDNTVLG